MIRRAVHRGPAATRATGLTVFILMALVAVPVWAGDVDVEDVDIEDVEEEVDGPTPRLSLLPVDSVQGEVTDIVTDRIDEAVRNRFDTLGGVDLVPTFEALHGEATGAAAAAAVSEAESQYTSGIGLVNAGEYQEAVDTLQRAVAIFEENVAELDNIDMLFDATANLAVAYHQTGFDLDARDAIERYAHLQPDAELDPDLFPPELIELFEDEAQRVEKAGDGHLEITADRDGADVYIDGEPKGETPLVVDDVGFGEHYMVVRDDEELWSGLIQVRARGQEQDLQVELRDPDDADDGADELPSFYVDLRETLRSGRFVRDRLEPYLMEVASQTGADYVSWMLVVPTGTDYAVIPFVFRTDDGTLIRGDNVVFDGQLSDVRSRSDELASTVGVSLVLMPDNQTVRRVDLAEELRRLAEQPTEDEPEPVEQEDPEPTDETVAAEEPDEEPRDPKPEEEPEDDPTEVAAADEPEERTDTLDDEDHEEVATAQDEPDEGLPVPEATTNGDIADPMPDETAEQRQRRMRYFGWGSAAAAATGAVATTVFLLVRSGGEPGFDAEVEW